MNIGVLALQGGFAEHIAALEKLGASVTELRKKDDLRAGLDGLILPGGESTVIGRLLNETGLFAPLRDLLDAGLPVYGTCAGMILLAKKIVDEPAVYFGAIDVSVRRNAYGRQLGSFAATARFDGIGEIPMTFIRAPYIEAAGAGVAVRAVVDGHIVAAECGSVLVTSFHPELTDNLRVHRYFLNKIEAREACA
ncbi:5'-phosphate synthase pdxT subunit [Sporobacter termitidis DSM 10068]|uniref:Pyridoxal 5'-phosphate synthase subunit PdxT n=1 Tax=Sporobacter termitidis DSM 10068 TaxID=1123282 RepID=A0A1M5VFU2_9FIRM|nr:pyridoxal 5'-phosphate synthase glutaminase subunit PdxT [Sporobacter termitidis]SHH74106.1 5'-phosphate synthase pdxT subunit [Sporobacter termitidis DSM 10068]